MAKRGQNAPKKKLEAREWSEKSVSVVGMFTDIFSVVVSIPAIFVILLFLSFQYHLGPQGWDMSRFSETVHAIWRNVRL